MPRCGHCGETTETKVKFCPECGAPLGRSPSLPRQARKMVTIVFSDLVDSTSLGENLDAESLREVMDGYFDAMQGVLEHHGGVVEKFIGDAVMAVFGLPRMHEDDALRAVRAAVGMRDALATFNLHSSRTHGVVLRSRTGVNTGVVVVGDATAGQRLVTGDAVNLAARLEQAAPADEIVLGPDTYRLVQACVKASSVGPLSLKGKSQAIDAWQLHTLDVEHRRFDAMPSDRPLVGRRAEIAAITGRLEIATSGGRVESVLVVGKPGVGKSRLVREVTRQTASSAIVLTSACRPYGSTSFWPIGELLLGLSEHREPLDWDALERITSAAPREERKAILDRVGSILGLHDSVFPLEEAFWATAKLFAAVSPHLPLVLVVEDLHWAQETLLDLLDHLRMYARPAGTLVLATARPELLDRRYAADSPSQAEVVSLDALEPAESDQLIAGILGRSSLPTATRSLIHRASEGNPLFVEQTLATWIEEGVLAPTSDGWVVADSVEEVRIPVSISAIFAARLDRLADEERLVLGGASVAGPTFDSPALHSMLALDQAVLDRCIQRLIDGRLVVHVGPDAGRQDQLAFEHSALRDVAYDMTLKSERAAFHERFAEWVARTAESSPADGLIGHHLAEATRYHVELRHQDPHTYELALRAARHLVADCQRALRLGDRSGAERMTGRVVELLSTCGPEIGSTDLTLMERTAKLLVAMGWWREAVDLLSAYVTYGHGPLLRDLGVAQTQLHRSEPSSPDYRAGQRLLERAGAPPHRDVDALASLAGTWKGVDDARAEALYRQCLDLDPADPYALGNVLEYELAAASGDLSIVKNRRDRIVEASRRCRSQADQGANLPWAFFDAGKFALLLGEPYKAIESYAKAAQLSTADHMLVTSKASLDRLRRLGDDTAGSTWARRLLALARAVRFPSPDSWTGVADASPLTGVDGHTKVVLLAGGTEATADGWLQRHQETLTRSFRNLDCVVVSGGTVHGVAGFAGALRHRYGEQITAIGYLPAKLPVDATVDTRYTELRRSASDSFSIGESLQAWTDLIASGCAPSGVRLLALGGGTVARAEYLVALSLGCTVGVIAGSGREADRLLEDPDWFAVPNLVRLELDVEVISRFLAEKG